MAEHLRNTLLSRVTLTHALRPAGLAVALATLFGHGALAADGPQQFNAAQRQEIIAIVRDALKTDPTILSEAIQSLRSTAEAAQRKSALGAIQKNLAALEHTPTDQVLGNPNGNLTVVEFYDPRCPYCRQVLPDLDKLVASDRQLRLVEKVIPVLGEASVLDSKAIVAAGLQHSYAKLQHALMNDTTKPSLDRIKTLAQQQGLDVEQLVRDMDSPQVAAIIQGNLDLARATGLDGTPTFIFGGKAVIPGAVTLDELRAQISQARAS